MASVLRMNDLDLAGKRVLIREDLNVPIRDGQLTSDARIRASLPTIKLALERGARGMVMSHQGRPKEGDFDPASVQSLAEQEAEQPVQWQPATLGNFVGITGSYLADDAAIREWYVANGAMLLFITYSCDVENRAMDDAADDEILDTLQPNTK